MKPIDGSTQTEDQNLFKDYQELEKENKSLKLLLTK